MFLVFVGRRSGLIVRGHRRGAMHVCGCRLPILLLVGTFLAGCSTAPSLSALDPPSGHPHDVVFVQGDDREFAQIIWDVGGPTEKPIPGAFLGAFMFSVPDGAEPRSYQVALENAKGRSNSITFTIPESPGSLEIARPPGPTVPFPRPRIDAVTIVGANFGSSVVNTTLYVQGANLDVGATIWVKDDPADPLAELPTANHRVLRNYWYEVSHDELQYPIYHYSSTIVLAGVRPFGQRIWLVAKNLGVNGLQSEPFPYDLPAAPDTLDSDGDGLRDTWETGGYDADADGVVDVDLPALGADPYRRDIFLELDIMDDVKHRPDRDDKGNPDSTVVDAVKQMFESAPILNVGEARGINLVIDAFGKACLPHPDGGEKCSFTTTIFDIGGQTGSTTQADPFTTGIVLFSALKKQNFDHDRLGDVYHYGIWGKQQVNYRTGFSDKGDDLVVTIDDAGIDYQTTRSHIETLAHELGHNLGQWHAGSVEHPDLKPNYLSVMSYAWVQRTAWTDAERAQKATCSPFYYAHPDGKEAGGSPPSSVNTIVDYSEGMARPLTKPATAGSSFCDSTISWSTLDPFTTVEDFANWRALVYDGPAKNGTLTP